MGRQNLDDILEILTDKIHNMEVGSEEPSTKKVESREAERKEVDSKKAESKGVATDDMLEAKEPAGDDEFSEYEFIDYESGEEANGNEDEEVWRFLCEHAPKVRKALDEAAEIYGPIIRAQIAEDKAKKAAQKASRVQQIEQERRARFPPDELAKRKRKNERDKERRKRRRAELAAEAEREREARRKKVMQRIKERKAVEGEDSDVEFILE